MSIIASQLLPCKKIVYSLKKIVWLGKHIDISRGLSYDLTQMDDKGSHLINLLTKRRNE